MSERSEPAEVDMGPFVDAFDDLVVVFRNLSRGGDRLFGIWARQFASIDPGVFADAVDRAIRDISGLEITPGMMWPIVQEVLRDRGFAMNAEPEGGTKTCSNSTCEQCGGRGKYQARLELAGRSIPFLLTCTRG